MTELLRIGAKGLIADAVEAELQELLGLDAERRNNEHGHLQIVRNGYLPQGKMQTRIGLGKVFPCLYLKGISTEIFKKHYRLLFQHTRQNIQRA